MSWTLGLEYLKVLVWPAITCIAIVLFRKPLHGLIGRISKVGAAGAEVEFTQAEEILKQADETIEAIENKSETGTSDSVSNSGLDNSRLEVHSTVHGTTTYYLAENVRRSAIEQVLREGARLGWEWARTGEQKPPDLDIVWTSDGSPQIINSTTNVRQRISYQAYRRKYSRYEDQIALALERILPQATLERDRVIDDCEFDFIVSMNGKKIAIEVQLIQQPGALLDKMQNKFSRMTEGVRSTLDGMLLVIQELPKLQVVELFHEAGIDIVKWIDSSDDLSLRRSIERLAEQ
ncbi:hypothetical protein [Nonomuraea helvata]|uniref:Uncharacterized protein n=1 Tax=Nonomuraea helvata TaxID=37484 RepID=A0ABV5RZN9_9ACTN